MGMTEDTEELLSYVLFLDLGEGQAFTLYVLYIFYLEKEMATHSSVLGTAARQASVSITNSQSSLRLNVHSVSDAIQPSHPLSSPSPPAPNPSQHQSLFQ